LENLKIRPLKEDDLDAIIEIDQKVLGEKRKEYWEKKLERVAGKSTQTCFVAELEGKIAGFILGDVSGWEFGVPDTIGWIDILGVDPLHQKKGVATALANELIKSLNAVGVKTIYTLVSWDDWDLLQFFRSVDSPEGI